MYEHVLYESQVRLKAKVFSILQSPNTAFYKRSWYDNKEDALIETSHHAISKAATLRCQEENYLCPPVILKTISLFGHIWLCTEGKLKGVSVSKSSKNKQQNGRIRKTFIPMLWVWVFLIYCISIHVLHIWSEPFILNLILPSSIPVAYGVKELKFSHLFPTHSFLLSSECLQIRQWLAYDTRKVLD